MRFHRLLFCFWLIAGIDVAKPLQAASTQVLILSGLAGDQRESDRLADLRQRLTAALTSRGVSVEKIVQAGDVNRTDLLAKLAEVGAKLHADDAFWLILLGHSTVRDDGPVFAVKGKRVTAQDLKTALAVIPARQYIFITTESSGGFIPVLAAPNRIILTATEPSGEINETTFPYALAAALGNTQNGTILQLARATAKNVREHFDQATLVQTEHAMLSDPSQPDPVLEPFDKTSGTLLAEQSAVSPPAPPSPPPALSADQNVLPTPPASTAPPVASDKTTERKPATPETLAILQQAHAATAQAEGFPAVILSKEVDYLVNSDQSQVTTIHQQVLIEKASGARWGDLEFSSTPPLEQITVEKARTIFPDGTYLEATVDSRDSGTSGDYLPRKEMVVRLPGVTPGCVIEYTVRDEKSPDSQISGIYEEIPVTDAVPILSCHLTLRLPKDQSVHYRMRHLAGDPTTEQTGYSQVEHWSWQNLPALEHLRYDPPLRDVEGEVLLSSYKTWNDFTAWYQRISSGSDFAADTVKQRAASVTAGLKTDREKLRALYEDVSKVRYAAIEIGVGAFRPHTAEWVLAHNYGDCKDKANLLLALARQVGIEGKFVLLNRTSSTDRSFPGFQFNHALTYFPSIDGGLWLDATDEITPFGQLPPGDVGRDGLMVVDAKFQTIPVPPAQATQLKEHLVIDPTGKTPGQLTVDAQGIADYEFRGEVRALTARQRDAFFRDELNTLVPGATLKSYTVSNLDHLEEPVHVSSSFNLLPGAEATHLNSMPMDLLNAVSASERNLPLVLNDGQPFTIEQTLDVVGITPGVLPKKSEFSAPGATSTLSYSASDNTLSRKLVINITQPTIPSADYPAFRTMIHQVFASILNTPNPPVSHAN